MRHQLRYKVKTRGVSRQGMSDFAHRRAVDFFNGEPFLLVVEQVTHLELNGNDALMEGEYFFERDNTEVMRDMGKWQPLINDVTYAEGDDEGGPQ